MDDLHPIRYWKTENKLKEQLEAIRKIYRDGEKKYGKPKDGILYYECPININPRLIHSFQDLQGFIFKDNEAKGFLQQFLKFWDTSRQVFAMDPELCEQLAETDIDDVPWGELRLPHEEFYLSFGDYGQETFEIRDYAYVIDGVYVKRVPTESKLFPNETLLLQFTSRLVYPSYAETRRLRLIENFHFSEPIYQFCVSGEGCATIGEAIARGEADYRRYCGRLDDTTYAMAEEFRSELNLPPGNRANFTEQKFDRGKRSILPAVPVLFNSLFYLCQKPDTRALGFPQTAPQHLVQEWRSTLTPGIKRSIESSLERKGFSKVYFVRDPDIQQQRVVTPDGTRQVRAHWRRGHWRHQQFGKNNAQRKWLWIKPVLVKKEDQLKLGTIHAVEEDIPN